MEFWETANRNLKKNVRVYLKNHGRVYRADTSCAYRSHTFRAYPRTPRAHPEQSFKVSKCLNFQGRATGGYPGSFSFVKKVQFYIENSNKECFVIISKSMWGCHIDNHGPGPAQKKVCRAIRDTMRFMSHIHYVQAHLYDHLHHSDMILAFQHM